HDGLDLAGAAAAEGGSLVIFARGEAGDALFEARELDHHEALEFVRPLHDLETAAAGQDLAAIAGEDGGNAIGIFLIGDGIDDPRTRDPIGWHGASPYCCSGVWPRRRRFRPGNIWSAAV